MFFDLFNISISLQKYINKILTKKLSVIIIIYINNILIYNNNIYLCYFEII